MDLDICQPDLAKYMVVLVYQKLLTFVSLYELREIIKPIDINQLPGSATK
jgi:hypothetical protein